MDRKRYNIWMAAISLVFGINGLAFILVSIFKPDSGNIFLIIGLLSVALGSILNIIRMQQSKRNGVK